MLRISGLFLSVLFLGMLFTSCTKEYSLENGGLTGTGGGTSSGTAVYTLDGAPGACTTPIVTGNYQVGTALDASNTIVLTVNVTTIGTYTISTGTANGISFSGSGTFLITGSQIIVLTGSGTPAAAGTNSFSPGTNGCSFQITSSTMPPPPVAVGTLDCTTAILAGVYQQSIALTGANTVSIPVNVTTAGTYSITTTATNGCTFSGSGTLALGAQSVVLTGTGTPVNAGTISMPVSLGASNCSFPITFLAAPPPAVYTLTGAPGACNPITVNGTYVAGTVLSGTANTATVQVNVTIAGTYTITTNSVNGMTFSATGVFGGTGNQNITLAGSGTPTAAGTNTFTVGTGGCTFDVIVTVPTSPCTGLVDGTFVMTGQFTLVGTSFGASLGSTFQVSIQQGAVQINVVFPTSSAPTPGTYSIGSVTMQCLASDFTNWTATSGSVYVSTSGGNTVVEFCNVSFHGTPIAGGGINSTGAGKMVF